MWECAALEVRRRSSTVTLLVNTTSGVVITDQAVRVDQLGREKILLALTDIVTEEAS